MHGGFENYLAEMIITTRRCIACKNHIVRSKMKVTVGTLSLCISKSCPTHKLIPKIGGIWKLFVRNDHHNKSKIKVTVHTYSLCKGISCSAHNFIRHGGIWKLFGTNDHQDKTMCPVQEPCCYIKGQVHSLCIGLNEIYLCPAHNFVVGPASGMVWYKDLVFHLLVPPIKALSCSRH